MFHKKHWMKATMKKRKFRLFLGLVLLVLGAVLFLFWEQEKKPRPTSESFLEERIPTFFFHGWGSSSRAEDHMTKAMKKKGVTDVIVTAHVSKEGQVALSGKIPQEVKNPLIKVEYADNKNMDYEEDARYAEAVVREVGKVYPFSKMNMVAHSMGNMSVLFYLLKTVEDKTAPRLVNYVALGSVVNGGLAVDYFPDLTLDDETGKPSHMTLAYQKLLALRDQLPKNQLAVLNIYGNYKNQTDGAVPNLASRSLRYLVENRAKSYEEKEITGPFSQYNQLHENEEVDQLLFDFLWKKKEP